ncbi:MAG: PAS domain-containing protein [Pseudomonadota bacterium]
MDVNDDDSTNWMIEDEVAPTKPAPAQTPMPWRVLIVDDDVDVHVVTKFSLSNACFMGRRISFLHAYSGEEALTTLRANPDVALVLLDVIMETSDAGLRVARQIRDVLGNHLVRIVLRTGQPGQALEHSIILDYDINDFWCKTDLTTRKLFTTVISSLRAYAGLEAAEQRNHALQTELGQARRLLAAVDQHALMMTINAAGKIADVNDKLCAVLHFAPEQLLGQSPRMLHEATLPQDQLADALQALRDGEAWSDVVTAYASDGQPVRLRTTIMPALDGNGRPAAYVAIASLM